MRDVSKTNLNRNTAAQRYAGVNPRGVDVKLFLSETWHIYHWECRELDAAGVPFGPMVKVAKRMPARGLPQNSNLPITTIVVATRNPTAIKKTVGQTTVDEWVMWLEAGEAISRGGDHNHILTVDDDNRLVGDRIKAHD